MARKQHRKVHEIIVVQMSSLERSASAGLVALVTSDLLFCAVGLPQLVIPERWNPAMPPDSVQLARFRFYYELYRGPLHNVFLSLQD